MRTLLTSVFLLIVAIYVACQPNQATEQKNSHSQKESPITITSNGNQNTAETSYKTNKNSPEWYAALKRPEWWLVIAAFVTFGVVMYQSIQTKIAAEAAKQSAGAARENIEHLVNSERAWVLGNGMGNWKIEDIEPDGDRMPVWIPLQIKNFGKTVARITKISVTVHLHQIASNVPSLPPEPKYPDQGECDILLPPDVVHKLPFPVAAFNLINVKRGKDRLYLYGFLNYRDIGKNDRVTRFCYVYHVPLSIDPEPEGFYPCGNAPRAYTEST